jgi:trans-aconitate methyltransferase
VSDALFDGFVDDYEEACARGVSLSGESRDYFARARVDVTKRRCAVTVRRVLDFGCGMGHSAPCLRDAFPGATIIGVDTSAAAIRWAQEHYGAEDVQFMTPDAADRLGQVDLVYSNGTFHHIPPSERRAILQKIFHWVAPGGLFALWENNPWNPGTRLVMKRIPFDRDAETLSYIETTRLLRDAGFQVTSTSFHFYFPAALKPLRRFEPWLATLPLGAQYCTVGRKP